MGNCSSGSSTKTASGAAGNAAKGAAKGAAKEAANGIISSPSEGSKFTLVYFDVMGRAEPLRLLCAYSGTKFDDKRIEKSQWPGLKESELSSVKRALNLAPSRSKLRKARTLRDEAVSERTVSGEYSGTSVRQSSVGAVLTVHEAPCSEFKHC